LATAFDFSRAVSLAIELQFDQAQPRHFGAPPARSTAFVAGSFNGEVARGASCNCRTLVLTPHCNGTHTESVGHLTIDAPALSSIIPFEPVPAVLVDVETMIASDCREGSDPPPRDEDGLVTRVAIERGWPGRLPFAPRAAILRTLPNEPDKRRRDYSGTNPAYLTVDAVDWLVAAGIEHLVLDLPSLDRTDDDGRLAGHRRFFGLPAGSTRLGDARRPRATITEFAFVPDECTAGPCGLQLQIPAWSGDAVPSRPVWLPLIAG
jgi:arylformamidase